MANMILPSQRQLSAAVSLARDDGKIDSRLSNAAMQTVEFCGAPYLFWAAGSCGNNKAHLAPIRLRDDLTFFVGYAQDCNANVPLGYWTPAARKFA